MCENKESEIELKLLKELQDDIKGIHPEYIPEVIEQMIFDLENPDIPI